MNTIMQTKTSFINRDTPFGMGGRLTDKHEALELAGLNYTVDSVPLSHLTEAKYSNKFHAAVRSTDGAILGVNSNRFAHFQPSLLGDFAEAIVKLRPDAYMSFGGQSFDERTQFLGVNLDGEPVRSPGGDTRNRIIMFTNGTNGNATFSGHAIAQEMRCMNMFRVLLKSGSKLFSLHHGWGSHRLLGTAMQAVQDSVRVFDEFDIEIEKMLNIKIDRPMDILGEVAGKRPTESGRALTEWEKRFDELVMEYKADFNTNLRGTAWGIVMAAEGTDEHRSRARGNRDHQRIGRLLTNSYPLTERALTLVS